MLDANISRRTFLAAAAGLPAATAALQAARRIPVALELFSLRQTAAKDLPATLAAIARMGYEGIELVGEKGGLQNTTPFGFSAKEVRKMADDVGLRIFSAHHTMRLLTDDQLEATVEFNRILGNNRIIVAWLDPTKTIQPWYNHAKRFNEIAARLRKHNMRLGFHNHGHELVLVEGQRPWDVFCNNTDKDIMLQLHVASFPAAKLDILEYLRRYPGRTTSLHLNDHAPGKRGVLLGEGVVDWKRLFETAETVGGLEFYIIEQESYPEGMSPMEAVERCLQNFRRLRGQ
ncbi:MAG: sugar phosphate isomerase/epimerase [Bryobacteraceae bacterium]|nr:sugar phosphate isomerase/epimerase [Bryobacteraceae bacterium]